VPGIFITSGMDLRLDDIRINVESGEIDPPTVTVRMDIWNHWLYVAREARDKSEVALKNVRAAASDNDDPRLSVALEEEFRQSMMAISSAAFAIDSFYASVVDRHGRHPQASEWRVNKLARYKQVFETLRWTWNIKPEPANQIRDALKQLYRFRDFAVHPPSSFQQPIQRPDIDRGVEWRFIYFRAENAVTGVRIANEVIEALLRDPSRAPVGLREWIEGCRPRFHDAAGYAIRDGVAQQSDSNNQ